MKPNEALSWELVKTATHPLLRNYWCFIFRNLRNRDIWSTLFNEHSLEHYPDPTDLKSKRTNFPRTIWQKDKLTWAVYYEGLVILKRIYDTMRVEFQLILGEDECIHKYSIPVDWKYMNFPAKGTNIKHRGKVNGDLVIPKDLDRTAEGGLTYILREIMIRSKLTRRELDARISEYILNPDNICTFNSKNELNIKSSITDSMLKWNINWPMFVRALSVLGYTELAINLMATKEGIADSYAITGLSIAW